MGAVIGLAAVLGLAVGTFVDVVISRVPAKQPLVLWRRRCPDCVRRRWVEVACAGLFAAAAARFEWSWELPAFCVLFAALLAIAVIDLAHYVIPNRILGPATVLGMALLGVAAVGEAEFGAFGRALAGGSAAFAGLLVTNLISPRGMGMGDVKLSFLLGLHLGWLGWGEVALGFFSAFFLSAVVGIFLVALRVRTRSEAIPFGPFLALGTVMTVLVGEPVLRWYSGA